MYRCPVCNAEVDEGDRFCHNCGIPLIAASTGTAHEGIGFPEEQPKRSRTWIAAVALIVLLVAASVFVFIPGLNQPGQGPSAPGVCPSVAQGTTFVSAPSPNYDLQEVMLFTQTYQQLAFNVTAVAQCDSSGYGPAYLLNGLTNAGYWYQVGINWDWPLQSGGYSPGFGFVSEAWAPGGVTRAPAPVAFSGTVNPGDTIQLSLSFSGGSVVASAQDVNTGASGSMNYPSRQATSFLGSQAQQSQGRFSFATQGYFTGLMTEWYHVNPDATGLGQSVTYTENTTAIASASLAVGEWNFSTSTPSSVFSNVADGGNPIQLTTQLQQFSLSGYTLSADAYEFITGP